MPIEKYTTRHDKTTQNNARVWFKPIFMQIDTVRVVGGITAKKE